MAKYVYMAHADPAPPVARSVGDRLLACGYPASSAGWGENIAYGYTSADAVMQGWLNSPGHRANIENPSYRAIGVGAAASSAGRLYWTQEFGTSTSGSTPPRPDVRLLERPGRRRGRQGRLSGRSGLLELDGQRRDRHGSRLRLPRLVQPPPTTSTNASPSSLTVNTGSARGGGVSSLGADDNAYFELASSSGSVLWRGRMTTIPNTLTSLSVTYRGLNSSTCTQNLAIWNWRTGSGLTRSSTARTSTRRRSSDRRARGQRQRDDGNGKVAVRVRCSGSLSDFNNKADRSGSPTGLTNGLGTRRGAPTAGARASLCST